jgi:hypothetical protein
LGWAFVVSLIKDGYDLAYLLRALPPEHSTSLVRHFSKIQLKELIGNSSEWTYLYQRLEPAESEFLLKVLSQE